MKETRYSPEGRSQREKRQEVNEGTKPEMLPGDATIYKATLCSWDTLRHIPRATLGPVA